MYSRNKHFHFYSIFTTDKLKMPTITHAGHVFDLLVVTQILDYRL